MNFVPTYRRGIKLFRFCINNKLFPRNLLQVSGFWFIFAPAKQKYDGTIGAKMTPETTSGIIYALTFEVCKRPHYTISGGTPVEFFMLLLHETCQRSHHTNSGGHPVEPIRPRCKSLFLFSDREGCRFSCIYWQRFWWPWGISGSEYRPKGYVWKRGTPLSVRGDGSLREDETVLKSISLSA